MATATAAEARLLRPLGWLLACRRRGADLTATAPGRHIASTFLGLAVYEGSHSCTCSWMHDELRARCWICACGQWKVVAKRCIAFSKLLCFCSIERRFSFFLHLHHSRHFLGFVIRVSCYTIAKYVAPPTMLTATFFMTYLFGDGSKGLPE